MTAFVRALARSSFLISAAAFGVFGNGCGGRTEGRFGPDSGGESSGGTAQGGAAQGGRTSGGRAQGGAPNGKGGSPMGTGGQSLSTGGRPATGGIPNGQGGMANRGGGGGSGAVVATGGNGTGGKGTPIGCGNGQLEPGEQCDDGNTATDRCPYGQAACIVCGPFCTQIAGITWLCGDGQLDGLVEDCDDGNTVTERCAYGQGGCTVCDSRCQAVFGGTSYCGDRRVDASAGESCDDGNAVTESCPYGTTSCRACGSSCTMGMGIVSYCGDGVVDSANGERCDDGNASRDCSVPCSMTCAALPGPSLTENIDLWPQSGLQLTATRNVMLESFVFNNQGKFDTIQLIRLSDDTPVRTLRLAPSASAQTIAVAWELDAGESYALVSMDGSNGRWALYQDFPAQVATGLRVDHAYVTSPQEATGFWFTFTGLQSCAR